MKLILILILLSTSCSSISNYITHDLGIRSPMKIYHLNNINDLKWKFRPLIISSIDLSIQLTDNNEQLIERSIAVITIKNNIAYLNSIPMSNAFLNSVNKKINSISKKYTMILIGLDGRIKKTYLEDIDMRQIFRDIDSMPMRINEMKNK